MAVGNGANCQSVSRAPTGTGCTQHMAFWALRERPVHCPMTDQCRPPGLDQRALRCVLVREREIHRKISGDLKVATFRVLRLTQCIKTSWYYHLYSTREGKEKRRGSCS